MRFAKMGIRFLNKRKLRTAMTVVAIALGVGILTGVNVTADSIEKAVKVEIYSKLGQNDIVVRGNRSIEGGWFDYQSGREKIEPVSGINTIVPRIIRNAPSYPIKNHSGGWNVPTIGIDTDNPNEKFFGKCNLTETLNDRYENTTQIEALFVQYANLNLPVVISEGYANNFNLSAGDTIYVFAENPEEFSGIENRPDMDRYNTTTWSEGTIIGIVEDTSEAIRDFMPPTKVWELYPPSDCIYVDIDDAWNYVFNDHKNQVNMLFTSVDDLGNVKQVIENIEDVENQGVFPGGIFTANAKGLFTEGILQVNFMMRGIFSIFSAISLLVCALIIKNLLEMSKEDNTQEIGIMRAVGVTKRKILTIYVTQILFISIVGGALGLLVGYYVSSIFVGSYVDAAEAVGTNLSGYSISPVMTPQTVLIGLASGVIVSIAFGLIPARSAANIDPLDALRSKTEKPKQSLVVRTIKKTGKLSVAIGITAGGAIIIGSAFGGLFLADILNPEIIVLVFIGVLMLVIGIILIGAFLFPIVVPFIANLFAPFLQKMKNITGRNLKRYSKQTKNTFAMLAIGISMMITVGTIMNSAFVGAYPGGRTIVGGDIRVGNFDRGQVAIDDHARGLSDLPSVAQAMPMRFSLGIEGLNRLDRTLNNQSFGGTKSSLTGDVEESLHIGIIDPEIYRQINSHDTIVKLDGDEKDLSDLMEELKAPYTIILQDRLARRMGGIETGENVEVTFDGFEAVFKVVGIFEVLPGFYWSYYAMDDPYEKQFCGGISWSTYKLMVEENIGKADVIAKNKIYPPESYEEELPDENLWGYFNTPIDYQTLENVAYQTGLVQNSTRRITSPFYGVPPFQWETNLTIYPDSANLSNYYSSSADEENFNTSLSRDFNETLALQNVLYHESGSISPNWNSMISRSTIIDPEDDRGYGNTTIKSTVSEIPVNKRNNVEDIIRWGELNYPRGDFCVLNEIYVNINISTMELDYVKRFVPGEKIRLYYNESLFKEFTVLATTNSHYPYEFQDDQGNYISDTAVFNYKGMSFNTFTYNTTDWDYFFEVLDVEPNMIFLPHNASLIPPNITEELIPQLVDNYLTDQESSETDNETLFIDQDVVNQALEQLFLINSSSFSGDLNSTEWNATYNYDGNTFTLNGSQFTYQGESQEVNFTLPIQNGTQILESIANGSTPIQLDNFTSLVYFDLDDNMSQEDIKNFMMTMTEVCSTIPTLQNVTFMSPKLFLMEESRLFQVYFSIGCDSKEDISNALYEIENYYVNQGLGWNDNWVEKATKQEEDVGGFLSLVVNMFFGVLSFALIVSLVGLAISTIISIKKRHAEIGTLRTLGFSKKQILKMVVGEGVITALYGIGVGLITGLSIASLIIGNLPFMIFLPLVYAPPYSLIFQGAGYLLLASTLVSFVPGVSAVEIDISEAIRSKGQ